MSKAAAITEAGDVDTKARALVTSVNALRTHIGTARAACAAAGKNTANEIEPHGRDDLIWYELAGIFADADLGAFLTWVADNESQSSYPKKISDYGALWTTRANNATIGTYL